MEKLMAAISIFSMLAAVGAAVTSIITYRNNKSPHVVIYLEADRDNGDLGLIVRNLGNGCAYNLSIAGFDYDLVEPEFICKVEKSFVSTGIPMLAPGQERNTVLCEASYARKSYFDKTCEIILSWNAKPKSKMAKKANFVLDYSSFANSLYKKSNEYRITKSLEGIYHELHEQYSKWTPPSFASGEGLSERFSNR